MTKKQKREQEQERAAWREQYAPPPAWYGIYQVTPDAGGCTKDDALLAVFQRESEARVYLATLSPSQRGSLYIVPVMMRAVPVPCIVLDDFAPWLIRHGWQRNSEHLNKKFQVWTAPIKSDDDDEIEMALPASMNFIDAPVLIQRCLKLAAFIEDPDRGDDELWIAQTALDIWLMSHCTPAGKYVYTTMQTRQDDGLWNVLIYQCPAPYTTEGIPQSLLVQRTAGHQQEADAIAEAREWIQHRQQTLTYQVPVLERS